MTRIRFTIRELFLVTVIVSLALGWWLDRSRVAWQRDRLCIYGILTEPEREELARSLGFTDEFARFNSWIGSHYSPPSELTSEPYQAVQPAPVTPSDPP